MTPKLSIIVELTIRVDPRPRTAKKPTAKPKTTCSTWITPFQQSMAKEYIGAFHLKYKKAR